MMASTDSATRICYSTTPKRGLLDYLPTYEIGNSYCGFAEPFHNTSVKKQLSHAGPFCAFSNCPIKRLNSTCRKVGGGDMSGLCPLNWSAYSDKKVTITTKRSKRSSLGRVLINAKRKGLVKHDLKRQLRTELPRPKASVQTSVIDCLAEEKDGLSLAPN
ncbi:unnamed protein product [Mesocestoides corti]|uniref:Uncharacterized protein n=2 Tax=Mesocestoides corti TaxID=53468 RepID=A0A0R3UMV4_MESCO|nr:unnamed protein product [Mesocestoides corti]